MGQPEVILPCGNYPSSSHFSKNPRKSYRGLSAYRTTLTLIRCIVSQDGYINIARNQNRLAADVFSCSFGSLSLCLS